MLDALNDVCKKHKDFKKVSYIYFKTIRISCSANVILTPSTNTTAL